MCLADITQRFDPPNPKERKAWKVFYVDEAGRLYGLFHNPDSTETGRVPLHRYRRERWLSASLSDTGRTGYPRDYTTGFHVFTAKRDALLYMSDRSSYDPYNDRTLILCPVLVRNVRTTGTEVLSIRVAPCLVADEMYIL